MDEKPAFIKAFKKPQGTEIKHINGHWYLYRRLTKYDPETKRSHKVSGPLLGTITEDGFIAKRPKVDVSSGAETLEYGAVQYFYSRSGRMREELEGAFPSLWERIYAIAMLRTIYGPRLKRIEMEYEDSMLSVLYPRLALSKGSITQLLRDLGHERDAMRRFLHAVMEKGSSSYLIDGHRILASSRGMEDSERGYDTKMRYKPQLNVVYSFSLSDESAHPAYYKKYAGSVTDAACFRDFLAEAGLEGDVTIVADKGFMSSANADGITDSGMDYIIPLKRGNAAVKGKIPTSPSGYQGTFMFNGRPVFCSSFPAEDGSRVHLFLDTDLYADEMKDLIARLERSNDSIEEKKDRENKRRSKGKGRLSDEELSRLVPKDVHDVLASHPDMGTITIETTRTRLNAEQVYALYKQRQQIEQCFKAYDDSLGFDSSYMHDDISMEAWLFLNHLSLMMEYDALSQIYLNGKEKDVSFEDLRQALQKVKAVRVDGRWIPAVRRKKIAEIADAVSFNPWTISLPVHQPKN